MNVIYTSHIAFYNIFFSRVLLFQYNIKLLQVPRSQCAVSFCVIAYNLQTI